MTCKQKLRQWVKNIFTVSNNLKHSDVKEPDVLKVQNDIEQKFIAFEKWANEQIDKIEHE